MTYLSNAESKSYLVILLFNVHISSFTFNRTFIVPNLHKLAGFEAQKHKTIFKKAMFMEDIWVKARVQMIGAIFQLGDFTFYMKG